MSEPKIFKDELGKLFKVYTGIDLSSATSIVFNVKKPNGTEVEWTATMDTDNNKWAKYTTDTTTSDFTDAGTWELSVKAVFPTGTYYGETTSFEVYERYEDN